MATHAWFEPTTKVDDGLRTASLEAHRSRPRLPISIGAIHRRGSVRLLAMTLLAGVLGTAWPATASPVAVIEEAARAPYAIRRATVDVTAGRTLSRVAAVFEYIYVPAYDSKDRLDPVLIDVPVIVREEDVEPGKILKLADVRLQIGRHAYHPRDVLLLDHTAIEPEPWLPTGAKIAIVSFNIPRQNLKPRFKVRLTYDQPHVTDLDGAGVSAYVPMLPDLDQLEEALHFKRNDFVVRFSALPEVRLRRESVNAHVVEESVEVVTVHPRHRETIAMAVEPVANETQGGPTTLPEG